MAGEAEVAKTLTVAAVTLALIAMPAHAQMNAKRHQGDEKKTERPEKKIDDKAYRPRSKESRIPRKSTTHGAACALQSPPGNRNR